MHNIEYWTYPEKCDRKAVQSECNHYASMKDRQEGCNGVNPIRWLNFDICEDYDSAQKTIKENDRGRYDCLAVRYYSRKEGSKPTSTESKCSDSVNKAQKAYNELRRKIEDDFHNQKSEYIGCKGCGSKLSRKHLGSSIKCPLCGESFLSKTSLDRISKAKEKIANAQIKLKEAHKKVSKSQKVVCWLVKFEYHT